MLARVLYVDEFKALQIEWFGMGALSVVYKDGRKRRAHPAQKRAFLALVEEFSALGQPISPANPKFSSLASDFADLLEYSLSSLHWRVFLSESKEIRAKQYASD